MAKVIITIKDVGTSGYDIKTRIESRPPIPADEREKLTLAQAAALEFIKVLQRLGVGPRDEIPGPTPEQAALLCEVPHVE